MNPSERVGRYELVRPLGQGGMAEVYLARSSGKACVIKRIRPELTGAHGYSLAFLSEARIAGLLHHPNIVRVFDSGVANGQAFIAMEYVDGLSALQLHRRAGGRSAKPPASFWIRIAIECCQGLAYAHALLDPRTGTPRGLVHRDVSPDNILVSRSGRVLVADWGVAREEVRKTRPGELLGKPAYMSPEQLRDAPLDGRADLFSLAVVLYELLTGAHPFGTAGEVFKPRATLDRPPVPIRSRRPDLPIALERIFERALAKDREDRHPDCDAFAADLAQVERSLEPLSLEERARWVERLCEAVIQETQTLRSPRPEAASAESSLQALPPLEPTREQGVLVPPTVLPVDLPDTYVKVRRPRFRFAPLFGTAVVASLVGSALGWKAGVRPRMAAERVVRGEAMPAAPPCAPAPIAPVVEARAPVSESAAATAPPPIRSRSSRPATGTVDFRIYPYGTVRVDDRPLGEAPFPPVRLPAGRHRIHVANPQLECEVTRVVDVERGRLTVVRVNLEQLAAAEPPP